MQIFTFLKDPDNICAMYCNKSYAFNYPNHCVSKRDCYYIDDISEQPMCGTKGVDQCITSYKYDNQSICTGPPLDHCPAETPYYNMTRN